MLPLRLVLDTNIIVSAALKPDGLQRTVLLLSITKPARLYATGEILSEYRDVLSRRELHIRKGLQQQFLNSSKHTATSYFRLADFRLPLTRTTTSSSSAPMPPKPITL